MIKKFEIKNALRGEGAAGLQIRATLLNIYQNTFCKELTEKLGYDDIIKMAVADLPIAPGIGRMNKDDYRGTEK